MDYEYEFCKECSDYGEPNGCNRVSGECGAYVLFTAIAAERDKLYNEKRMLKGNLAAYRQAEQDGRLVRMPHKIGDKVYVIASCHGVRRSLDGTMYSHDGSPGTATGYYCAYNEDWDNCPLARGREECDEKGYAVFEDTISAITVYLDEDNEEANVYVGLSHIVEYRDDKIYNTEESANAAFDLLK